MVYAPALDLTTLFEVILPPTFFFFDSHAAVWPLELGTETGF